MALQLGSLRDALLQAKVEPELAAEEVAGYENSITKLTTLVQVVIGLTTALLISQVALWTKLGEVTGQLASVSGQLTRLTH